MVTNNKSVAVIAPGGKALAKRKADSSPAKLMAAGLTVIREQLNDEVMQDLVVAADCADDRGQVWWLHKIQGWNSPQVAEYIEKAKAFYRWALRRAMRVDGAVHLLRQLRKRRPDEPITREQATLMLHMLFVSITGKRRDDEAAMTKLAACADIFSPANNALGHALELWEPVPLHPVVLALAIKRLRASKTFEPSEEELRDALGKVVTECARLENDAREWLDRLQQTDLAMFKTDPDGWRAAHTAADGDAIGLMNSEEDGGISTAKDEAYHDAQRVLWDEMFDDWGRLRSAIAVEPPQQQIAACEAKPDKRTKKLKQRRTIDDDHQ